MENKNCILTKEVADKKLQRMALEIAEQLNGDATLLVLVGIKDNGLMIAEKIYGLLTQSINSPIKVISCKLDKKHPDVIDLSESINFDDVNVIVIDDVSNSGRTLLYALKPLLQFHPKRIQTLVLVERMHNTFPIKPDYVGLSVATTMQEHIQVEVSEGEIEGAYLL